MCPFVTEPLPPLQLSADDQRRLQRLAAVPVVIAVAALIGQVVSATLATKAPLLLIAMTPTDPFLILTVTSVPTWAFFTVGFIRLVLPDPFLYLIGSQFGPAGRAAIDAQLGPRNRITRSVNWLGKWFPRFGLALIVLLPNYAVCLLSGLFRVRPVVFAVLNAVGTGARLYIIWRLGRLFSGPIATVLDWLTRYQMPFLAVMFALVASQVWSSQRPKEA